MKFRIASDLHTEFYHSYNDTKFKIILENYFPIQEDEKNQILLLAGDIGTYKHWNETYNRVFKILSKRFNKVITVPGNHSWYESEIWGIETEFLADKKIPKNVHYLDNGYLIIDKKIIVIGACLWTDFDNGNPYYMQIAQGSMNDYNYIKKPIEPTVYGTYPKTISSKDVYEKHITSKQFLIDTLKMANEKQYKIIVVSHHAPTYNSIEERFKRDSLNPAYCSHLEEILLDYNINYWIHGHQHGSCQYDVGLAKVICNSFGYHNYEVNPKFNANFIIEI